MALPCVKLGQAMCGVVEIFSEQILSKKLLNDASGIIPCI